MKSFYKLVLAAYVLTLLWVVLFKFSYDFSAILASYQTRSLNLIPFVYSAGSNRSEVVSNFIAFVPFGLLLSVTFKRAGLLQKLVAISLFSLAAEIVQYVLAIGVTDITDVIMNTLGGLAGLLVYSAGIKIVSEKNFDRFVAVTCAILLIACILIRVLLLRVQY